MKAKSLWFQVNSDGKSNVLNVSLSKCLNCGQTKLLSDPCSMDHLAAFTEYNAAMGR